MTINLTRTCGFILGSYKDLMTSVAVCIVEIFFLCQKARITEINTRVSHTRDMNKQLGNMFKDLWNFVLQQ